MVSCVLSFSADVGAQIAERKLKSFETWDRRRTAIFTTYNIMIASGFYVPYYRLVPSRFYSYLHIDLIIILNFCIYQIPQYCFRGG